MKGAIATIGMFDGMHLGHASVIAHLQHLARQLELRPIVVTFANHPLNIVNPSLAPRLLMSAQERKDILSRLVDVVMLDFDDDLRRLTAAEFMQLLHDRFGVTTLLMGYNHRFGSDRLTSVDDYRSAASAVGIDIVVSEEKSIPSLEKISSTRIRRLISSGDVALAAQALGRYYSITGAVVHGHAVGRTIGFPTANIQPLCRDQLIPAHGVYACFATLPDGSRHPAMVNIGSRPTVNDDHTPTIEAHLIDCETDLYGQNITIEFVERIRDEQRFPSLDALQAQLQQDKSHTLVLLNTLLV